MKESECCVVSFGNKPLFEKGMERLGSSLKSFGVDFIPFKDYPEGPSHEEAPYAFKTACVLEAEKRGYRYVIWADSPGIAIRDPMEVFKELDNKGYYFVKEGFPVGEWASDDSLEYFGMPREEAMGIQQYAGKFYALDMKHPASKSYISRMLQHIEAKRPFLGSWTNLHNEVSADPRVRGHRHDQIVGGIVIHRLGLDLVPAGYSMMTVEDPDPLNNQMARKVFLFQGILQPWG